MHWNERYEVLALKTLSSIDNFPSVSSVDPKEGKLSTISNSTK